ncbi:XYPPX repeat protein [Cooperia oncophora]
MSLKKFVMSGIQDVLENKLLQGNRGQQQQQQPQDHGSTMNQGHYGNQSGGYTPPTGPGNAGYNAYDQQGGYPQQGGGYQHPGGYPNDPPQQGGYPPPGGYPPQSGGYPPPGGYPPQSGGYPPQSGYPQGGPQEIATTSRLCQPNQADPTPPIGSSITDIRSSAQPYPPQRRYGQ